MHTISTEQGNLLAWSEVEATVRVQARGTLRFGQALYNLLYRQGQAGRVTDQASWSGLFHARTEQAALAEFYQHYEIIDGYIVPK